LVILKPIIKGGAEATEPSQPKLLKAELPCATIPLLLSASQISALRRLNTGNVGANAILKSKSATLVL
jgi:hypothetical protein